ncbi:MAG: hypothetical protein GX106_01570 [Candidatus Cloacimonetes bacterium]|nr:hypothetical protein [Candidatus Cloacimonadota bacterium]
MKNKVLIILTFLGVLPCMLLSITLNVKQDGSGDYTQIQDALDAADPGDTILVYPGRYFENLEINKNNITLKSLEAISGDSSYIDSTIIDGNNVGRCVASRMPNFLIRGFSITNGITDGGAGGIGISEKTDIINCNIFGNQANAGGGINVVRANVYLSGVNIYDNYALAQGGGIHVSSNDLYPLSFDPDNRCSIYNNRSGGGQDLFIRNATRDLDMPLHTFSVLNPSEYHAKYINSSVLNSIYEINFDILNAYHEEIDSDLYVSTKGDDANDGLTPATALKTIHEAIYRAASNSENRNSVFILPGEYSRTSNDQIFPIALKQWVKVQGSGIDVTKIICEPNPLMGVGIGRQVFLAHVEPHIFLDGMSITTRGFDNYCAVIHSATRKTEAHLSNLRIHDISAGTYGTADNNTQLISLMISGENESSFENIIIEDIDTGVTQLLILGQSIKPDGEISAFRGKIKNLIVRNFTNSFTSQSVWAHRMVSICADEELIMENCEFRNLTMLDDDTLIIQIVGVQFPQQQNHFTLRNCLIADNVSPGVGPWGGGIATITVNNNAKIDIINCIFAGNQSNTYTLQARGEVNFINSIFDNDSEYQIRVIPMDDPDEQTHLTFDYCLIKNGIDGILEHPVPWNSIDYRDTNIDGDPLFADSGYGSPGKHNYNLSEYSPCVDSGTPDISDLDLPPYDLAGNIRVWNGRIDMGCYEYNSEPWVSIDDPVTPYIPETMISAYPNPFKLSTGIKIDLHSEYDSSKANEASLKIYNIKGQLVRDIPLNPARLNNQQTQWDGRDAAGKTCANSIYFLMLEINGRNQGIKKITLIR